MRAVTLLLCVSASLPDSLASEGAVSGAWSAARLQCHRVLHGVVAAKQTDFELAAHCRARLPMDICRRSWESLGPQPWSQTRMQAACSHWEAEQKEYGLSYPPERRLQDAEDIKVVLDEVVNFKAAIDHVAMGRIGNASADLNGVLRKKTDLTKDFEKTIIKKVEFWERTALALENAEEKTTGHAPPKDALIRSVVGILDTGLSTPSRSETLTMDDKAVGEIVHYDRPVFQKWELEGARMKRLTVPAISGSQILTCSCVMISAVALLSLRMIRSGAVTVSDELEEEHQAVACERILLPIA